MTKGKLLAVCLLWLVVLGVGAAIWRLYLAPAREQQQLDETSADSRYRHQIDFALDSFSGYAVLRSQEFRNELAKKRIKVDLVDDAADYSARIEALQSGEVQMAVFTIDALIKASADLGELPATIVAVIDETRGADAMVAHKKAIPNVDALNDPRTKFVLTPNSPSETLARVVVAHFQLDALGPDPFIHAADAEDVYKRYRTASPDTHQVFVLWEPYVSKILENPNAHVVVDSSKFRGYIVDVIVASRDFLAKNPDAVADVVEAYFRAFFANHKKMVQLVLDDARTLGAPLTPSQAEHLVEGVWWKNTQENYAHFGIRDGTGLQHLEDMIDNINDVLLRSGGISTDPTDGRPNLLYYDKVLRRLQDMNFHPGAESIRDDTELPALSDLEWDGLVPVGTMEVPPLVFARGTTTLTQKSHVVLDDLMQKLQTWPQYYVLIRGNASLRGDLELNEQLALDRAKAAQQYLTRSGINKNRVHAVGGTPSGATSVSFVLGQTPY